MAYIIKNNDGQVILTVSDNNIDKFSTSLDLIGKNVNNYGEALNNNFVKLLTSFASTDDNSPRSPQVGQLWFNKTSNKLTVFDGSDWASAYGTKVAGTQPITTSTGDLWYDTVNSQLYIWDGNSFNLIAPQVSGIYGKFGLTPPTTSTIKTAGTNIPQNVGVMYSYGSPTAFITTAAFLMSTSSAVQFLGATSATNVVKGFTIFDDLEVKGNLVWQGKTTTTPAAYGAVGNGINDDGAALQAAIDTGKSVILEEGKTYYYTTGLLVDTSLQYIGGPGILKPAGNINGILIYGGATGVELELTFNAPDLSGTAVRIDNASRVRIKKLHGIDIGITTSGSVLHVQGCNVCTIDWLWAQAGQAGGKGITWYGSDAIRSDILRIDNAVLSCGGYGLDWDGNCHSLEISYLGIVGGTGAIIRNTSGITTFPAIGRFNHIEIDYPTSHGVEILAGLDYDFDIPYILGAGFSVGPTSNKSGFKIGPAINSYQVRIHGGKSIGNTAYGIESEGGVVYIDGSSDLSDNTKGRTTGSVWTSVERLTLDFSDTTPTSFYIAANNGSPLISFDENDYISYNRTSNELNCFINAQGIFKLTAVGPQALKPLIDPVYNSTTLPAGQLGMRAMVTDATTAVFNQPYSGGGVNVVPVFNNGSQWMIG